MSKRREKIHAAIKAKDDQTAEKLLLQEINHNDKMLALGKGFGVGYWEYERLAIIYRRQKAFDKEIDVLERYRDIEKKTGRNSAKVLERLRRAKVLDAESTGGEVPIEYSECRYAAFDLEIAKILPASTPDLKRHRPLGITCAGVLEERSDEVNIWYSVDDAGLPSAQMTRTDLQELVSYLEGLRSQNVSIVTWNGFGFDFDILAEESGLADRCKALAKSHIDLMLQFHCTRGFPIALDAAADAMLGQRKTLGTLGYMIPQMWKDNRHLDVIEYLKQDCSLTLNLAHECDRRQCIQWTTQRGRIGSVNLSNGLLFADQALALPLPDTSWMDEPVPRTRFTEWICS